MKWVVTKSEQETKRKVNKMTDREYRDIALLNYVKAILDEKSDFPNEEILRMFLEKKIGAELITEDVSTRMNRMMREMLSDKMQ